MNIFNDLPTAFPWYNTTAKQNRFRPHNGTIKEWGLISPNNALLPFEYAITIPVGVTFGTTVSAWQIFDLNDQLVATIASGNFSKIHATTKDGRQYVYYGGDALTGLSLSTGHYYSKITLTDGLGNDWFIYSEVFQVPECIFSTTTAAAQIPFLKLEWYNDSDLSPIFYNDIVGGIPRFRNVVYLDTFVHQSEPEIIADGEKDGYDETVETFQKCLLKYRITEIVPDFLKLAFVVMQMHDHVKLTTEYGLRSGEMHKLTTATTSEQGGAFSTVDILFEEDVAMIKKACATNMA